MQQISSERDKSWLQQRRRSLCTNACSPLTFTMWFHSFQIYCLETKPNSEKHDVLAETLSLNNIRTKTISHTSIFLIHTADYSTFRQEETVFQWPCNFLQGFARHSKQQSANQIGAARFFRGIWTWWFMNTHDCWLSERKINQQMMPLTHRIRELTCFIRSIEMHQITWKKTQIPVVRV